MELPYVLTDSIKVILFIKIVIRSSEVSRQYSLNKNYEIWSLQGGRKEETLTVLKQHKPLCIEFTGLGWPGLDTMRTNRNKTARSYNAHKLIYSKQYVKVPKCT